MQSAPGISRRLFRDCRIRFAHAPNDWLSHPMSWASLAPASTPPCSLWSAPAEWRPLTLHDAWAVMSHVYWNGRSMFTSSGLLLASPCLAACVGSVGVASGSSVVWQQTSVFSLVALPCPALLCHDRTFCLTCQLTPLVEYILCIHNSQFTIIICPKTKAHCLQAYLLCKCLE